MEKRRQFLKKLIAGLGVMSYPFAPAFRIVHAKTGKIVLPKDTDRKSLIHKDPETLDTRNLELTPLEEFRTMGIADHPVDLDQWRLEVTGGVRKPLQLTYAQIQALPSVERDVLLTCPGIFVNHGRWKGISMKALMDAAETEAGATHVTFSGPKGNYEKTEQYPIDEVLSDRIFVAYGVNGKPLPQKHGFPLRLVAEGYYGQEWVKFVDEIEVNRL